jgi:hypothetical protein
MKQFIKSKVFKGEVARLTVFIDFEDEHDDQIYTENQLLQSFQKKEKELELEISELIRKYLGKQFTLESISIKKGSITIIAIIAATIATFDLISKYKDFIDSLDLIKNQVSRLINRFIRRNQPQHIQQQQHHHQQPAVMVNTTISLDIYSLVDPEPNNIYSLVKFLIYYLALVNLLLLGILTFHLLFHY